jgi:hypothetical protein
VCSTYAFQWTTTDDYSLFLFLFLFFLSVFLPRLLLANYRANATPDISDQWPLAVMDGYDSTSGSLRWDFQKGGSLAELLRLLHEHAGGLTQLHIRFV